MPSDAHPKGTVTINGHTFSRITVTPYNDTWGVWYNGKVIREWRKYQKFENNAELLAQGRVMENAQNRRRFNSLPFSEYTSENRATAREQVREEIRKGMHAV